VPASLLGRVNWIFEGESSAVADFLLFIYSPLIAFLCGHVAGVSYSIRALYKLPYGYARLLLSNSFPQLYCVLVLFLGSVVMEHQDVPRSTGEVQPRDYGPDAINPETPEQEPTKTDAPGLALGRGPPVRQLSPDNPSGLQRSGTLPIRSSRRDTDAPDTRRRGATTTSRTRNIEPSSLSRAQAAGRNNSTEPSPTEGERMDTIPEGQKASGDDKSLHRDRSSNSGRPRFTSQGTRPRVGTWTSSASPRQRNNTLSRRRPSVALGPRLSGRAADTQSQAGFSLAGPPLEVTVPANQPYVDVGYSQLNPAYDQPLNTRPVWGLAGPLPHVLRPGMVPTRSEAAEQPQDLEQGENGDLEQGRIEPTLRLNKISSQLQNARQNRENQLLSTYSRKGGQGTSNIGVPASDGAPLSPTSDVIAEGEGEDLDDLDHFPSLDDRQGAPSTGSQARKRPSREEWYPSGAFSAPTVHDDDGYLDGDDLHAIPLRAYEPGHDEVHNLHTHWSVIRLRFREPLAELLAVCITLDM
jgi:aquaglyceroporin related protein